MRRSSKIAELLQRGMEEAVYPGAVLLVAMGPEVVIFEAVGNRMLVPYAGPMRKDTIFDLASLTKPLATTLALMKLVEQDKIDLNGPLPGLLSTVVPRDKLSLTSRHLLCHSGGFPDWKPFYLELEGVPLEERKRILRRKLIQMPLLYEPGKEVLYSDLGFMILEYVIEEATGMPLPVYLWEHFYRPLGLRSTFFGRRRPPAAHPEDRFAATERCPWRNRVICGVVHDENAYALGGFSGHAGLFSTAREVYSVLNLFREHFRGEREDLLRPGTVRTFFERQNRAKRSTWALGWDTPSHDHSSSGRHFSERSVGHLGFTGTSIWIDLEKDVMVVFLTNRIHPTRKNEKIKAFRPMLHDRIMEELGKT